MNIPKSCEKLITSRGNGVFKLYWLHHKDHTDFCTQGYIGITGRSLRERMNQHSMNAEKGIDYPIYNAIRKYKDDIVVDVLCIGDEDYILSIEASLRDVQGIGWNIDTGGSGINSETLKGMWNSSRGDEWRKARKIMHQENPNLIEPLLKASKEFLDNGGKDVFRQKTQEQWNDPEKRKHRENANKKAGKTKSKSYDSVGRWLSSKTNHYVWENAKTLYDFYLEDPSIGRGRFAKKTGYTENEIDCIHRKYFKKGWNPYKDEKWIEFYERGLREKYGK